MKDGLRLIETPLKLRDQRGLISLNVDSVGNWYPIFHIARFGIGLETQRPIANIIRMSSGNGLARKEGNRLIKIAKKTTICCPVP